MVCNRRRFFWYFISENGLLVVLFTVFVTRWMTKYPEKWVFFLSSFLYTVAMLIFPMTANFWVFLIAMAIFTLGELATVGLQESFVSKLAPEDMRGQYFAAASFRYTIGRTIAPLVFPLVAWIGFTWTFVILSSFSITEWIHLFADVQRIQQTTKRNSWINWTRGALIMRTPLDFV